MINVLVVGASLFGTVLALRLWTRLPDWAVCTLSTALGALIADRLLTTFVAPSDLGVFYIPFMVVSVTCFTLVNALTLWLWGVWRRDR